MKNVSCTRSPYPPIRTKKDRTNRQTPRKGKGHSSEKARLIPIIVSVSLLLLVISPLYMFIFGYEMTPSVKGSPVATVTGIDDNDYFGWNVSSAGDVNGDGYDDIIVGAPGCDNDRGGAYLFFGGPWFSGDLLAQNANVTLNGDAPGDLFGWDVSDAGDVNKDGFDDVIVGAPGADSAYLIFGNDSMKTSDFIPNTILIETFESGSFNTNGWTTQNGSLNDGGVPYQTPLIHQNGSNANNPSSTVGAVLRGGDDTDNLNGVGTTSLEDPYISIALDISSYMTIIVTYNRGAQDTDNTHNAGEDFRAEWTVDNWTSTNQPENTYIAGNLEDSSSPSNPIWGQRTFMLPEVALDANFTLRFSLDGSWEQEYGYVDDILIEGATGKFVRLEGYSGSLFGSSVSEAGDVNQDGYDDVLVGAPGYDNDRGIAHTYFGSNIFDSIPNPNDANVILCGNNIGNKFGSSVSSAWDVNNDGLDDVLVGAPGANKAVVFLNYGQSNPMEMMLLDDFEDGILADWYEEEGANGATSVDNASGAINGSYHLTSTDDTDVVSPIIDATGYHNLTLSYRRRMRDGNWAGNEDLLVMIRADGGSWMSILSEETHGDTQTPDLIEDRQVDLSPYGANNSRIEIKFDLNDGGFLDTPQEWDFDDIRINGTPYFSDLIVEGGNTSDQFGFSVSSAGDIDFDGYGDILIGAPHNDSSTGAAYIFAGTYITMENSADGFINLSSGDNANVTFTGEASNDLFGFSVSFAGNLTGDGFSDVIVGAPGANGIGAVYMFYGSSSLPSSIPASSADYFEFGESVLDYFGWSVSEAGDVIQADGYDEILVGAPFHDPNINIDAGRAYILGAVSRPVIRDVSAVPDVLNIGGNVNITCQVTAIEGVGGVWVNISLPGGGYINDTMIQGSGDQWFYNNTYITIGTYQNTIWATDIIGNWTESSIFQFEVVNRLPTLLSGQVSPATGFVDTWFNFTVIYTDLDDHIPGFITVNITGIGIYDLVEVNPLDIDYTDGKEYYFDITGFNLGQYTFDFAACDFVGDWTETIPLQFDVVNRGPALSSGQVTPTTGFINTWFNFTVTYTDLDDHAPGVITVNITNLGIYPLNEVDPSDLDYTDGKQYFIEITAIPLGTSYSFHFAANDTLGTWANETPEIDAPDVLQRAATLTALDETVEYSDIAYLNATLVENGTPIAGEDVAFYIDVNDNGVYEPGELAGSGTTLPDGSVSVIYTSYLSPDTYDYTAIYIGSKGFDVDDSFALLNIYAKPATLTAQSRLAEEDEDITLNATLFDNDGNPVASELTEYYIDKNKNGIYEGGELIGSEMASASGVASFGHTVNLVPGDYDIWARYVGSGNYSVTEIEGVLIVQNTTNTPPAILGTVPDQIKPEDSQPWILDLTSYEADIEDSGADLKWYITGIDTTLYSVTGLNNTDDVFTFIPVENAFGNDEVTLWLVDSSVDSTSQVMWVNITPVNDLPYFDPKPPDIFVHYNDPGTADDDPAPWDYTFYVHDIETPKEGLAILTSEPTEDSGDGYTEVTGLNVTFHYPQSRVGDSILVTLTLYDGFDNTQTVIMVNVTSDWVPELVRKIPDIIIEENTANYNVFDLDNYFIDKDHDSLFFSSGFQHLTVVINSDNTVDITSAEHWTGSELITFRAMDPSGAIVEDTITVTVVQVNDAPVISGAPDLIVHYDYSYGFDITPYIEDPDNSHSELSLWTSELTDNIWIQEYNNLGFVVNYPESMEGMTFPVTIFVSDGVSTASQEIQITISDNFPPELMYNQPDVSFDEDTVFEDAIPLSYYFLDIDGDALFFSNGSTFIDVVINNDLTVDFSAPENWYGFETVTFRATDPTGSIAEDTILIVVVPVNDAPTIDSIPGQEKNEGDQWILDLSQYMDDVDNDASELIITVESESGQGYVTLTGDILVFQYPEGIYTDIVTVTVSDGELETQRSFTVSLQSHTPFAPSIWNLIPWHWVLLMFFVALGGAFAHYKKKSKYIVHEAFLIHEKGLPIAHASRAETSELEDVVVSGMFTAVQDFISDAFTSDISDEGWELDEMKFGENKILIERSKNLFLAVIFEGHGKKLRLKVKKLLGNINDKYGATFKDWNGDMTELGGINPMIVALISKKPGRKSRNKKNVVLIGPENKDDAESYDALKRESDIVEPSIEMLEGFIGEINRTDLYECPVCGSDISANEIKCPICNTEFGDMEWMKEELSMTLNELMECPSCGAEVTEYSSICPECGVEFIRNDKLNEPQKEQNNEEKNR